MLLQLGFPLTGICPGAHDQSMGCFIVMRWSSRCQGGAWPEAVDHDLPVPRLQTMTGMPVEEAQQRLQTPSRPVSTRRKRWSCVSRCTLARLGRTNINPYASLSSTSAKTTNTFFPTASAYLLSVLMVGLAAALFSKRDSVERSMPVRSFISARLSPFLMRSAFKTAMVC